MATVIRWLARIAVLVTLIFGGSIVFEALAAQLDMTLMPHTEDMMYRAIVIGTAIYVFMMALPFVPGAEIGLALLTMTGGELAPLVYLATTASLMLAFSVGRLIPSFVLARALRRAGFYRAEAFVHEASQMTDDDLRDKLSGEATPKFLRALLRYRFVAIVLAINMPGNIILGGGGGIALMAGLSRLFDPLAFLLAILLAVLPVPLLFHLGSL